VQLIGRVIERIPGVSSPRRSRDGAFVVKDSEREVKPFAKDQAREARLWLATTELLQAVS
jgi:hypothetical protein